MSSKYEVRTIAGIRECAQGLLRALEKIENPPIKPFPNPQPVEKQWCPQHGYPLPCNKCGLTAFVPGSDDLDDEITKQMVREYWSDYWQPYKATKVIESGYKCSHCGWWVTYDTIHFCPV